jgi:hypothetical protein
MAKTFDEGLATDKDWVRFAIGDFIVATAVLDDDTINAVLGLELNKWLAAASCAQSIAAKGKGLASKKVEDLQLTWEDNADSAYARLIADLKEEGALQLMERPRHMFVL